MEEIHHSSAAPTRCSTPMHLLRLEEAVGHRAGNDRREDGAPVHGAVGRAHLQAVEADLEQVGAHA